MDEVMYRTADVADDRCATGKGREGDGRSFELQLVGDESGDESETDEQRSKNGGGRPSVWRACPGERKADENERRKAEQVATVLQVGRLPTLRMKERTASRVLRAPA